MTPAILPPPVALSTEDKVDEATAVVGALAGQLVPGPAGAVISESVQLEPEIYHLISALIHLFGKKK